MEAQDTPYAKFPSLDLHLGVWEGNYRYYDAATGQLIKEHTSKLTLKREHNTFVQNNTYTYPDGKVESFDFKAQITENRLEYSLGRVEGYATGADDEAHPGYILFYFKFKGQEAHDKNLKDQTNKEMIHMIAPNSRMRTQQLSNEGKPAMFVQTVETRDPSTIPPKAS